MTSEMVVDTAKNRRAFLLRKAHSLSGVLPVGVFLIEHLWTNASALGGRAAFDRAVSDIQRFPALPWIELFGIILPLAFHALYGVKLSFESRPNALTYLHGRNLLYVLQRVTGGVTFVFVCVHLWELRVQKWLYGMSHHAFFDVLAADLSWSSGTLPIVAVGYAFAIACAVFHFSNGLLGFAMSWGLTVSRRAQRTAAIFSTALGAILFLLGLSTVVYFATGTRLFPVGESRVEAPCPDPH